MLAHTPIARHDEAEAIIENSLEHFREEADRSPACARRLEFYFPIHSILIFLNTLHMIWGFFDLIAH